MDDLWPYLLRVRPAALFAAHLVLAALVTAHALLRKREVASAAGWIGLAWLAPVMGAVLYLMFGINRVQRRARQLRPPGDRRDEAAAQPAPEGDGHLRPLERGIGRITGRQLLPGRVQVYHDGDEAYPPMLAAIAAARHSVSLSSYIFRTDTWGGRFIDALADAHRRGMAVRVLVDGIGGGWLLSGAYHRLRRRGVPAARFMHSLLPWRMPFINLRSHKKTLVVDGMVAFTGGMNIADENVKATRPQHPVQDTHFRVEGPVVAQVAEDFAREWAFVTQEELQGAAWFPDLSAPSSAPHGAPARVVDSGPDEDLEKIEFAILQAVACARDSIAVMTPYFLPDERLTTALALAAIRGVAVDVVVPKTSDHRFVDWAAHANVGPLLAEGVRIWRCPPPFRHTKALVVDGEWCLVGSCNWDIRSFRLNFELCLEVNDRGLAGQLTALTLASRGAALTQSDLDRRSLPVRLRNSAVRLMLPYL